MNKVASKLIKELFEGAKVLMYGDLGVGKTTFVKAAVNELSKDIVVTSPTFAVVKVYDTVPKIYHADLYRIADPYEIEYIDLFNDENGVYFVEWSEYLEYLTPSEHLKVTLEYNEDVHYRNLEIKAFGEKYEKIISNLMSLIV